MCYNGEEAYEINDFQCHGFLSIYRTKIHAHIYAFSQLSEQENNIYLFLKKQFNLNFNCFLKLELLLFQWT